MMMASKIKLVELPKLRHTLPLLGLTFKYPTVTLLWVAKFWLNAYLASNIIPESPFRLQEPNFKKCLLIPKTILDQLILCSTWAMILPIGAQLVLLGHQLSVNIQGTTNTR